MKNLGTILSIIALAGVSYLIISQPSAEAKSKDHEDTSEPPVKMAADGAMNIAFVNSDSLLANYELHQEYKAKLEAKADDIERELDRRSQAFQENIAVLEQNAANMSPEQIQQTQLELQELQQRLLQYRDERTQDLAQEEQEFNLLIKADVDSALAKVQAAEGYDFIFSYGTVSELLAANPAYDITDIVVKALNEAYQENKEGEQE